MRTKFFEVGPNSQDVRTIHARSPAAPSPYSFVRPYAPSGDGASDSTIRRRFRPVEDVVGRPHDERGAERRRVLDAADVDGGGFLWVVLGAVDIGPGRRVQHELARDARGSGVRDVPVGAGEPPRFRERLEQCVPELPTGAGYEDATASRDDRIGVCVLHSSLTRGSSQASECSSGSAGSYSRVTW